MINVEKDGKFFNVGKGLSVSFLFSPFMLLLKSMYLHFGFYFLILLLTNFSLWTVVFLNVFYLIFGNKLQLISLAKNGYRPAKFCTDKEKYDFYKITGLVKKI